MSILDHGQPYKIINKIIDNVADVFKSEETKLKEEHDIRAARAFDYCPDFAGKKCGRPGCSAYKS